MAETVNDLANKRPNNEGKWTLLLLAWSPIGKTDDLLTVGDVIQVTEGVAPLIVREINDFAALPDEDADAWKSFGCDKIAYLHYEETVAQKFSKRKATSKKHEKTLAKKLGGKTQAASGAGDFEKGDVKTDEFLAEHKYTDAKEYRLQLKIWSKISNEAYVKDLLPMIEVVLDSDGEPLNLIIMDLNGFCEALGVENEQQFVDNFMSIPLESDAKSILLKKPKLAKHIEDVTYNHEGKKATFLIRIDDTQLVGIGTNDFMQKRNEL